MKNSYYYFKYGVRNINMEFLLKEYNDINDAEIILLSIYFCETNPVEFNNYINEYNDILKKINDKSYNKVSIKDLKEKKKEYQKRDKLGNPSHNFKQLKEFNDLADTQITDDEKFSTSIFIIDLESNLYFFRGATKENCKKHDIELYDTNNLRYVNLEKTAKLKSLSNKYFYDQEKYITGKGNSIPKSLPFIFERKIEKKNIPDFASGFNSNQTYNRKTVSSLYNKFELIEILNAIFTDSSIKIDNTNWINYISPMQFETIGFLLFNDFNKIDGNKCSAYRGSTLKSFDLKVKLISGIKRFERDPITIDFLKLKDSTTWIQAKYGFAQNTRNSKDELVNACFWFYPGEEYLCPNNVNKSCCFSYGCMNTKNILRECPTLTTIDILYLINNEDKFSYIRDWLKDVVFGFDYYNTKNLFIN